MTNNAIFIPQQQIDDMLRQCYLIKHKIVSPQIFLHGFTIKLRSKKTIIAKTRVTFLSFYVLPYTQYCQFYSDELD